MESKGQASRPVYRSVNRPLTVWGIERRLFFAAAAVSAATFNFFASLPSGLAMFAVLAGLARWAGKADPQILPILLRSARFRPRYDPAKWERFALKRVSRHDPPQPAV